MRRTFLALFASVLVMAGPATAHEVSLGLAKDDAWPSSEHIARMQAHALTDHATVYYKLNAPANLQNPYDWVRNNYLAADIPVVLTLIIDGGLESTVGTSEGTDVSAGVPGLLARVARGDFDEALTALASRIAADGRPIIVRPFHELDGGWYRWGIYAEGNSSELAVQAVRRVIDMFDLAGARNVSWEINFNRRDGRGQVLGEAEYLIPALNELVDAYSVSTYNRCGTSDRYPEQFDASNPNSGERSFADDFAPIYERITGLSDLPVNVAEVSTSGMCGPRIAWFEEMLTDIQDRFPQTKMVTFFFGVVPTGKASNDVPIYWGFDQSFLDLERFRDLVTAYRAQWEEASAPAPRVAPEPVRRATVAPAAPPATHGSPERTTAPEGTPTRSVEGPLGIDSMPFALWGRFSFPLSEEGNPAINTVTGDPFGETGPVLRFTATQRFLWELGNDVSTGPGISLSGALSSNDDQYWNNQVTGGLTYGFYGRIPGLASDWALWSAEAFAGRREYLGPIPNRLSGGEEVIELRFGVNIGHDWLK